MEGERERERARERERESNDSENVGDILQPNTGNHRVS